MTDAKNESGPRVFEEGALTLVVGPDGANAYVGSIHLGYVETIVAAINLKIQKSSINVSLSKKNSKHDQELENCMRLIKTLPWIKIT